MDQLGNKSEEIWGKILISFTSRERQSEAVIRAGSGAPGAELPPHYEGTEWSQCGPQHWLLQQTDKETGQWDVPIINTTEATSHFCRCGSSTTSIGWITCFLASALMTFCRLLSDCLGCSHPARPLEAINHNNPRKLYYVQQILIIHWKGLNSDQDPTVQKHNKASLKIDYISHLNNSTSVK